MMNRHQRIEPRLLIGIGGACVMVMFAGLASPAGAQTQQVSAQPDAVPADSDEGSDEDDLLEPSDTGYIDDATIGTRIRLRFDAATGADRPDRAEFIYGKCLCFTAFGQDGASPGPTRNLDSQEIALSYEYAFSDRFSLFVELPFRSVDISYPAGFEQPLVLGRAGVSNSGLGDIRPGLKYALIARPDRYLTFQLKGYLATGKADEGLGTDHDSIEPGLLFFDQRSRGLTLAAELRWWHALGGSSDPLTGASIASSDVGRLVLIPAFIEGGPAPGPDSDVSNHDFAGDVLRFGLGVSYEVGSPTRLVPVAEVVGWHVLDGFATPPQNLPPAPFVPPFRRAFIEDASGDTIVNLKLGVRIPLTRPGSVYVGYGIPLTGDEWYDGILRLEYRVGLSSPRRERPQMAARDAAARAEADRRAAAQAAEAMARKAEESRAAAQAAG